MKTRMILLVAAALMVACQSTPEEQRRNAYAEGDRLEAATKDKLLSYTFEDFIASPDYCNSRDMWRGAAIEWYAPHDSVVEILLKEQRGRLFIHGQIAMDFPVCSGREGGKETPKGKFRITEKKKDYRSNLYGSFMRDGRVVKGNVKAGDKAPAGCYFEGADMPCWMRFNGAIGMHVGNVHRISASHGCVRVPEEACSILFSKLSVGSVVIVK